jgi:hypothetical protein
MMANGNILDGEKMSGIQFLASQVQDLSRSLSLWNGVLLWALGIGAVAALGVVITTRVVIVKGQQLAKVQADLIRAKDEQVSETLQKGERNLEAEKMARVELEQGYAPRRLSEENQKQLAYRLKKFAGQTVSTWFHVGDHEGYVFCSEVASVLGKADWDVYAPASIIDMAESGRRGTTTIPTGVYVESTLDEKSKEAMETLVRGLNALGFDAKGSADIKDKPAPVVVVYVNDRPEGPQGEAKLAKARSNKK